MWDPAKKALYKAKEVEKARAQSLAEVDALLPLPKNATFEELVAISRKVSGNSIAYPKLIKAIKEHPAYKKVIADLNTGELGRNYTFLKKPGVQISHVAKVYKQVSEREAGFKKAYDAALKRAGNDPVKLVEEHAQSAKKGEMPFLEKKIRSLPEYKEFLEYDKEKGFSRTGSYGGFERSKNPSREFLRFKTYLKFATKLPEGTKMADYIVLPELLKKLGKDRIPTPKRLGSDASRYKFFDFNQIVKFLGEPIVSADGREFFPRPTDQQVSQLKRFFKEGRYLFGENTEDIVKAIHKNEKLRKILSAKNFPALHEFHSEIEKVLGRQVSDSAVAHGTRVYSDWTKGSLYKNMGLEFQPSASEVRLGNKIYSALEGFKRNNKWAQGEYLHAMREIKKNMPKAAGDLGSFKYYMGKYLPEGMRKDLNLNINEIFSIKQSARNKAFPYAYFVDVIDADINQKNLANFQGKLSAAVYDTRNMISKLRAGDTTVSYADIVDRINKFQNERKTHGETIKRFFPGKNFNLADIVLGSEKEILKSDFDIAGKVYSTKNLEKWKKQGIDIGGHAKTAGFAMTGADKRTSFLFRDLVNISKELFKQGSKADQYEIAFKLGCVGANAGGGRISFALGSSAVNCVNTKLATETEIPKLTQLDDSSPVLSKMKNAATGFLNFAKKGGKFGAIAAAGAASAALVKTFMNDDPTTYLSNEDQQKNMLIEMLTGSLDDTPQERPDILDWQLPVLGAETVAGTAVTAPSTIEAARSARFGKTPSGVTKTALKTLGRGLMTTGTPLGLAALEPLHIAGQIQQGDSPADIATNPWNYLGPAFMPSMTKAATKGLGAASNVAKVMRLGLPMAAVNAWNPIGWGLLAGSLGIEGYKQYQDYKNKRGWFSDE